MMDVTPLVGAGKQIIQSYAHAQFRVSGTKYQGAIIVLPDQCLPWSFSKDMAELALDDFKSLTQRKNEIDVILLGCGKNMKFLPMPLRTKLKAAGLNVDIMDTGAACRTYNVLMAEGRRVAAMLLPHT